MDELTKTETQRALDLPEVPPADELAVNSAGSWVHDKLMVVRKYDPAFGVACQSWGDAVSAELRGPALAELDLRIVQGPRLPQRLGYLAADRIQDPELAALQRRPHRRSPSAPGTHPP